MLLLYFLKYIPEKTKKNQVSGGTNKFNRVLRKNGRKIFDFIRPFFYNLFIKFYETVAERRCPSGETAEKSGGKENRILIKIRASNERKRF